MQWALLVFVVVPCQFKPPASTWGVMGSRQWSCLFISDDHYLTTWYRTTRIVFFDEALLQMATLQSWPRVKMMKWTCYLSWFERFLVLGRANVKYRMGHGSALRLALRAKMGLKNGLFLFVAFSVFFQIRLGQRRWFVAAHSSHPSDARLPCINLVNCSQLQFTRRLKIDSEHHFQRHRQRWSDL